VNILCREINTSNSSTCTLITISGVPAGPSTQVSFRVLTFNVGVRENNEQALKITQSVIRPYCHGSRAQSDHVPWLAKAFHAIQNVPEINQLMRKTKVAHKDSRAFAMGNVLIKEEAAS
jgi:hypothetical protein